MNITNYALNNRAVTLVLILFVTVGGYLSYGQLGRLEDPDFTIKEAVITTLYPGATAEEVEKEISEPLETAIQQLKQLEQVRSISRSGLSIIYAEIQDSYDKNTMPQVWDELRRKIAQAEGDLPPGSQKPVVNDDFGDVYGLFFAITGDGYSLEELQEIGKDLRRELLLANDVGRIDFWGAQQEVVYVEMDKERISRLGITPQMILQTISGQNVVTDSGSVRVGSRDIRFRVSGDYENLEAVSNQLLKGATSLIRIKDVATITKGYLDPPYQLLRHNGKDAVGLGISTVAGGNVVVMGDSVKEKLADLTPRLPVGVSVEPISYQADTVRTAVNGFVLNLLEAVVIVVVLLVVFMGFREGIIIGVVLVLTILATFIAMAVFDINLQRISLGALVIALGMLVDNAIVVTEGIVVKSSQGMNRRRAAVQTVNETQWPLLGATVIAILAFAAISLSKDVTGEFLGSLFQVIGLSLFLSWVFAVTVVPYLCVNFLPESKDEPTELYSNLFYRGYKRFLSGAIRKRWITILVVLGFFASSVYGFKFVDQNFFPDSTRPQFMLDLTFPEGTHIEVTEKEVKKVENFVSSLDGVTGIDSFIGSGALRFILTYSPEMINPGYGQLLVTVDDYHKIDSLRARVESFLDTELTSPVSSTERFKLGPGGGAIEVRFQGADALVLRQLAEQVKKIMLRHDNTAAVESDWGERVLVTNINRAETRSNDVGVSRPDIANALESNYSGLVGGLYRQGEKLLPLIARQQQEQGKAIEQVNDLLVWSNSAGKLVPLAQVTDATTVSWEDPVIKRRDRMRTVTVTCKQKEGTVAELFSSLRPLVEEIELPSGYTLEWGGEYESSTDANNKLMEKVPLAFTLMFLVSVMLFNNFRSPIIIFLGLPLALVGVTVGLLVFKQPFGFMALLGFLSLSGMLMKNEIVLLDQIKLELRAGKKPFEAIIDSAASRVRPVAMAAFTTILGMIPLLWDAFFVAMAVTIMGGLTFATLLTLVVVPVLYATFHRINENSPAAVVETGSNESEGKPNCRPVTGGLPASQQS